MKRTALHLFAVAGLSALLAVPVIAHSPVGGLRGHGIGPRPLARLLDLTAEQRERSRELLRAAREQTKPLRAERRALRAELATRLDDPATDDATVSRLARRLHEIQVRLAEERRETREGFEALLTPRQKEKLETLRDLRQRLRDLRRDGGPPEGLGEGP